MVKVMEPSFTPTPKTTEAILTISATVEAAVLSGQVFVLESDTKAIE